MAFTLVPVGDVSASTIEGVSRSWVRLPQGSKPIRYIYTGLPVAVTDGRGVVMSSIKGIAASSLLLNSCDVLWADIVGANTTQNLDLVDFKVGVGCQRIDYAAAAAAGIINAGVIGTTLATAPKYRYLEAWVKCSVATAAGDFNILLDDTAKCASPIETLPVPALTAGVWKHIRVALANPQLGIALISTGVVYTVDVGACSFWIDDIRLTNIARQLEVVQVVDWIRDGEYFALTTALEQDDTRSDRYLMVYYQAPEESSQVTT